MEIKDIHGNLISQSYKKYYYTCRNAEELHNKTFIGLETCLYDLNKKILL